jgi:hypothetical protein
MKGFPVAIITGGVSASIVNRFRDLKVPMENIYQKSRDKVVCLNDFCQRYGITPENVAYIGDDLPDIGVMKKGEGYAELLRDRERRAGLASAAPVSEASEASSNKELYLKKKKETADARNAQKRLEKLRKEAEKIEGELDEIEKQMAGEAAYDYKLLAELDEKKNALEERLLEIYEEI